MLVGTVRESHFRFCHITLKKNLQLAPLSVRDGINGERTFIVTHDILYSLTRVFTQ